MYQVADLFDRRSTFAIKLEKYLEAKSITKTQLCKEAGISRPTLDKILSVEITNRTNFIKHVTKILDYLRVSPDSLMSDIKNPFNRMRQMKNALKLADESVAEVTGICVERLKEIESGAEATKAELRDIAFCFQTSVRGILGTNYFDVPMARPDYFTRGEIFDGMRGFWGHLGIRLCSHEEYFWYPISYDTKEKIYGIMEQKYGVIPCMNNKLLLLHLKEIDHMVLLDEACDPPYFANWDSSVSEGEVPLAAYEALDDYYSDCDKDIVSPKMKNFLECLIQKAGWNDSDINEILHEVIVYFRGGQQVSILSPLYYDEHQTLTTVVQEIYEFGDDFDEDEVIRFEDLGGAETLLKLSNMAMMEIPLVEIEDAICQQQEELIKSL